MKYLILLTMIMSLCEPVFAVQSVGNSSPSAWHPVVDPSCVVSAGGTSCTTTFTIPGQDSMRCTANDITTALGGIGYSIAISLPSSGIVTLTYGAVGIIAGGGTTTFSVLCVI